MTIDKIYNFLKKEDKIIAIDSKKVNPGDIFFAFVGARQDAHDFLDEAFDRGASYAVVEKPSEKYAEKCIVVESTLEYLNELATYRRKLLNIPIIAITGSFGKTTTKELITRVLEKKYSVFCSPGNYNSKITLPISIINIPDNCEIAVLELGATEINDIEKKCALLKPTLGLVTNVGPMHLETFKSIDNIKKTKFALYDYLISNNGVLFLNCSEENVFNYQTKINYSKKVYYQSVSDSESVVKIINENPFLSYKNTIGAVFQTHLLGAYQINNISAAYCVGKYFGVNIEQIDTAIVNYVPTNNRCQKILTKNNNIVILDAYNASLDSMIGGVKSFVKISSLKKWIILAEMKELGSANISSHNMLGEYLKSLNNCFVILCGENMRYALDRYPDATYCANKELLVKYIKDCKICSSSIYIKGSRSWSLETIVEYL